MAKKKEDRIEPLVSSIPVPPSDSALVIDLPEGQKLLVGKIEAGTVIEVATWRGTGRPDSRTNRLMLGMSSENNVRPESDEPKISTLPQTKLSFILSITKKSFRTVIAFAKKISAQIPKVLLNMRYLTKKVAIKPRSGKQADHSSIEDKIPGFSKTFKKKEVDDISEDFQRILDEVSQRRLSQTTRTVANSTGKKPTSKSKSGSKPKKPGKMPK